ncbi:MAG: hypothetical protein ACTSRG_18995 [Candidatus Helarchaeota archaeon]
MVDEKELERIVREEISKKRKLGEYAGGSGHLAFTRIIKFSLGEPKEILYRETKVYEVICEYNIHTETEFLHSPENDIYYTKSYKDRIIFDKELNILEFEALK